VERRRGQGQDLNIQSAFIHEGKALVGALPIMESSTKAKHLLRCGVLGSFDGRTNPTNHESLSDEKILQIIPSALPFGNRKVTTS
jgi:hypothetical protein